MTATIDKAQATRAAVANSLGERLIAFGWFVREGTAIATKNFDTAAGQRSALAYLQDWGQEEENFRLAGQYESEGNNILSTCSFSVPKTATAEVINGLAEKFAKEAESTIDKSYARRLHLMG